MGRFSGARGQPAAFDDSAFYSAAREQRTEAHRIVIAAGGVLRPGVRPNSLVKTTSVLSDILVIRIKPLSIFVARGLLSMQ
uniref:Uncharacterized protein n=1 Tax=Solibacter usitatus (strain Ellin6076) TaxID=234267 RepID=Q022T6_SOLUE